MLFSFPLCHIMPASSTLVILERIIDGEKLCRQGAYNEHTGAWGHMMHDGQLWDKKFFWKEKEIWWATREKRIKVNENNRKKASNH